MCSEKYLEAELYAMLETMLEAGNMEALLIHF